jgi:hypothetical protein
VTTQNFRVSNELGMWLRSEPVVDESTQKVLLPKGQLVSKLGESGTADWWRISTHFKDLDWEGVSKRTLMVPDAGFIPAESSNRITPVHLQRSAPVIRNQRGTEAFRLNEQPQPSRDASGNAAQKAEQLGQIIDWLRVSENKRYKPTETTTFCNIYAYDYCCLAGAYLPRVWWTQAAINRLVAGQPVNPTYGVTVDEITANQLAKWFRDYGQIFGWRQTTSLTDLQLAANAGAVCIINARKIVGHGHICAIVPETAAHKAEWDAGHSRVTKPLTSQAGRQVFEYRPYVWWNENYRDLGFWIHD